MPRGERIGDITQRMILFEKFWQFRNLSDWLKVLPYSNESTVSRVKNGHTGISYEAIEMICTEAGITERVFRAPLWELAEALEVTDEVGVEDMLREISHSTSDAPSKLFGEDNYIIKSIPGDYVLLYPGREDLHFERKHIILEKIKILPSNDDINCNVIQVSNFITGEEARGKITSKASRLMFFLEYHKSYYVDSNFLMSPLFFGREMKIFSGIYLDTAPMDQNQIFSTQFCMFSVNKQSNYPRRYKSNDAVFKLWEELLDNSTESRGRLIARSGDDYAEKVRFAVRSTIKKEEH